jgi:predicted HicB family RNase H-like nuclease
MKQISAILKAARFMITEGSEFQWKCFPNGRYINFANEFGDGHLIADCVNGILYEVAIHALDESENLYRWQNADFRNDYCRESKVLGLDAKQAWQGKRYATTDSFEDILDKVSKIMNSQQYDTRVVMEIELDDETLLRAAKEAHRLDITLNKYIEKTLRAVIESEKAKNVPIFGPDII